jgi:predicted nuclease of restriction endonuclease-like (RecB) superfamily
MTPPDAGAEVRAPIQAARDAAARQVNALLVRTHFEIGRRIVEHDQGGEERAEYSLQAVASLAQHPTAEFGRGFSKDELRLMPRFYLTYRDRLLNSETPSQIFESAGAAARIVDTASPQSLSAPKPVRPVTLSSSHYAFLTGVKDDVARLFYEIEATRGHWSLRELRRQFDRALPERQLGTRPEEALIDPYVPEFLGPDVQRAHSESGLEIRIIAKLEQILRELDTGFPFEGRQRRFTFEDQHFFVDLVFYNRLPRPFLMIDLKIGQVTHQDLGQMQTYVNFYDRFVKLPEEAPTVGILMCRKKNDAIAEITPPLGANIHAREYTLALPSAEELRRKLLEWTEAP